MQYSIVASILALTSVTMAVPAKRQAALLCATGTPQCCAVNVLNLADLNCANPPQVPANVTDFTQICSDIGQQAQCCDIPIVRFLSSDKSYGSC